MAVTLISAIHGDLADSLTYVTNEEKTTVRRKEGESSERNERTGAEKVIFVTGVNCHKDKAEREMRFVQTRFGRRGGRVTCYHAKQSFRGSESSPELCHEIGVRLAEEMWGEDYQVVVTTHLNTDNMHNHFIVNPISMWSGAKWQNKKKERYRFRDLSDELCRKYGLSVIGKDRSDHTRKKSMSERSGKPSKFNLIRETVDRIMEISYSMADFCRLMNYEGYIVEERVAGRSLLNMQTMIRTVSDSRFIPLTRVDRKYEYFKFKIGPSRNQRQIDVEEKRGAFWEKIEKENRLIRKILDKNAMNEVRIVRNKPLYEQYEWLADIIGIGKEHRLELPFLVSPECKLACQKSEWYARQLELTRKHKFKTVDEMKALQKDLLKNEKGSSSINKTVKLLGTMIKHAPRIPEIIVAERKTFLFREQLIPERQREIITERNAYKQWSTRDERTAIEKVRTRIGGERPSVRDALRRNREESTNVNDAQRSHRYDDLEI